MTPGEERGAGRSFAIPVTDFLWFIDHALDQMVEIVEQAGDDLANRAPGVRGANSLYAMLTHCLGVMNYWGGYLVAGRHIERDREAEFTSRGPVAGLIDRTVVARRRLHADVALAEPLAALRNAADPQDMHLPMGTTQAGALLHVFEELRLHLGHMQITLDLLMEPPSPT